MVEIWRENEYIRKEWFSEKGMEREVSKTNKRCVERGN